ncbi:Retrovirus-related Pol polyprotein [Quillaja saponaria]|uniref:Retrovirus-related Pol polyprotein n=1 Tax=Quillaja saponaria TaxID=32244 RepID=A0AAD7M3X9_QUISA|nr:Retrovirus-related Pol polyprotein [Quillaja saponaria]
MKSTGIFELQIKLRAFPFTKNWLYYLLSRSITTWTAMKKLFLEKFAKPKKEEKDKEILEMYCKVEVNIPLLDAIKHVPRYAKILKELCTSKHKFKGDEKVSLRENVLALIR